MILLPLHKAVFVSTPKCATNTMYEVLKAEYGGQQTGDAFHWNRVPRECLDWFSFTVCRNPYARAVSVWASSRGAERYGVRDRVGSDEIRPLFEYLLSNPPWRSMFMAQHEWLANVRLNTVLRLEDLENELWRLTFWTGSSTLPRKNPTYPDMRKPWKWYYEQDAALQPLVEQWAGLDFERYGYSRVIDDCQ